MLASVQLVAAPAQPAVTFAIQAMSLVSCLVISCMRQQVETKDLVAAAAANWCVWFFGMQPASKAVLTRACYTTCHIPLPA
jgi:hypothetical protein